MRASFGNRSFTDRPKSVSFVVLGSCRPKRLEVTRESRSLGARDSMGKQGPAGIVTLAIRGDAERHEIPVRFRHLPFSLTPMRLPSRCDRHALCSPSRSGNWKSPAEIAPAADTRSPGRNHTAAPAPCPATSTTPCCIPIPVTKSPKNHGSPRTRRLGSGSR